MSGLTPSWSSRLPGWPLCARAWAVHVGAEQSLQVACCWRRRSPMMPCRWRSAWRGLMWPTRSSCAARGQTPGRPPCCRWRRARCRRRPRLAACASGSASRSCRRAAGRLGELLLQEHSVCLTADSPPALATAGCRHTAPLPESRLFICLLQLCLQLEASASRMPRWRRRSATAHSSSSYRGMATVPHALLAVCKLQGPAQACAIVLGPALCA